MHGLLTFLGLTGEKGKEHQWVGGWMDGWGKLTEAFPFGYQETHEACDWGCVMFGV